jgi:hypothetical protein
VDVGFDEGVGFLDESWGKVLGLRFGVHGFLLVLFLEVVFLS